MLRALRWGVSTTVHERGFFTSACFHPLSLSLLQVFVPPAEKLSDTASEFSDVPIVRFFNIARTLLFGWPMYLLTNISGREYSGHVSHFDPYCEIFSKRERGEIVVSDAALGLTLYGLYSVVKWLGWAWFAKVGYFVEATSDVCQNYQSSIDLLQAAAITLAQCLLIAGTLVVDVCTSDFVSIATRLHATRLRKSLWHLVCA